MPSTQPNPSLDAAKLLNRYLHGMQVERNLSPYTLRNYRSDLSHFLEYLAHHDLVLDVITRRDYRDYVGGLQEGEMAPASVRRRASTVKAFFKHLFAEGHVQRNPLLLAGTPKIPPRLPTFLTREQVEALLAAPNLHTPAGLRDRAILEVLYGAGIRVSELASLRLASVDSENAMLRVLGKGRRERVALMGNAAVHAIADLCRGWTPRPCRAGQHGLALAQPLWGTTLRPRRATVAAALCRPGGVGPRRAPAFVATFICHPYARRRCGCACGTRVAGPCQRCHHADLYARDRGC